MSSDGTVGINHSEIEANRASGEHKGQLSEEQQSERTMESWEWPGSAFPDPPHRWIQVKVEASGDNADAWESVLSLARLTTSALRAERSSERASHSHPQRTIFMCFDLRLAHARLGVAKQGPCVWLQPGPRSAVSSAADLIGHVCRSVERFWGERESFGCGGLVEAAIPGGEQEIVPGEHESGREMQGVHAAQFAGDRELGGVFD